ncbi:MAG: hypothetical protein FWH42_03825 [Dehalococcoidia bacterium]|nr:hypothetical protein [Dehalococcoidia bacterium]
MASVKENNFREWVFGLIRENGSMLLEDAITIGATKVNCSTTTTKRYLVKLTNSSVGELTVKINGDTKLLVARPGQNFLDKKLAAKMAKKSQQNTRRKARKTSPKAQK